MVKVSWGTDKAGRNREKQAAETPRNDTAKKEGGVVRGSLHKASMSKCPFSHERGAGSA